MNSDSVKWLIAGVAGALLSVCLFAAGGYLLFRAMTQGISSIASQIDGETIYGPDEWEEDEAKHNEKHAALEKKIETLGLNTLYTNVYVHDNTRYELYTNKNFGEVETRLTAKAIDADTPIKKYRYGQLIRSLGNQEYNENPEEILAILDEWVALSPDSHFPWMVRGTYKMDYAYYFRGGGWSREVSQDGMMQYRRYNEEAKADLLEAARLTEDDAEPFALLINASAGCGEDLETLHTYFQQCLERNPDHFNARWTLMNFSQPRWFGSWEALDAQIEEAEAASESFPKLMEISRLGLGMMSDRDPKYETLWDAPESDEKWAKAALAQAEQSPDDLHVLADAAYYSCHAKEYTTAADLFVKIGNNYPTGGEFSSIVNFHEWRGYVLNIQANDPAIYGTPKEKGYMEILSGLARTVPSSGDLYLAYLVRQQDDALTQTFYAEHRGVYLETGDWGNPPDYVVMDAMARAGLSDEFGVYETEDQHRLTQEALTLAPDNAYVQLMATECFITKKEYDLARVHLEKARELDPAYLPALHIMGWLSYHQKQWADGIRYAKEFLATEPSIYLTQSTDDAKEIIELCEKRMKE